MKAASVDIAAETKVVNADNRIPLRYYYRIAANLFNQARVYREDNNIVDLYVILIRFSSLVSETIPQHQDYPTYAGKEKVTYRKILREVVDELEALKPAVQRQLGEVDKRETIQNSRQNYGFKYHNILEDNSDSLERPALKDQVYPSFRNGTESRSTGTIYSSQNACEDVNKKRCSSPNQMEEQLSKLSLHVPKPRDETLSRHSFLKSSCLQGKWEPSFTHTRVEYPGNIDLSPSEIPSLQVAKSSFSPSNFDGIDFVKPTEVQSCRSLSTANNSNKNVNVHIVRQPTPSPVLSCVQNVPAALNTLAHVSSFTIADQRLDSLESLHDNVSQCTSPQYVQISPKMMEDFLRLAKSNTEKNLETCGILAGSLKKRTFYVTTLILPKQESTSDSCHTMNEEEIYTVQDERSLFPLGWIHTHPLQSCFMSSVDLHTHYSYQIMLPEAIAIVMAPTDSSRKYGIFRLIDPGGITVLKQCQQRGFHPHEEPPDGSPLYDHCSNVLMNPNLEFDIVDIR